MKYIAHRGNLDGPILDSENNPEYLDYALYHGFDVELDLNSIFDPLFKFNVEIFKS